MNKRILNKALAIVFALIMGLSCFACTDDNDDGGTQEPIPSSVVYTTSGLRINPGSHRIQFVGITRGTVVDDDTGLPIVAQIQIFDRTDMLVYRTTTDYLGRYELSLPDGNYDFIFSKGSEYEIETLANYTVYTTSIVRLTPIKLKRLYNVALDGWYCGDLHQHSTYSDGDDMPSEVLKSNLAVGLSYAILSGHNNLYGTNEFSMGDFMAADVTTKRNFITIPGWEVTTNNGHYQAINHSEIFSAVVNDTSDIVRIANSIKSNPNAIAQINHPGRKDELGFKFWLQAALFDTLEVWNGVYVPPNFGGDNLASYNEWLKLMKQAERIYLPLTGGTDNHGINGKPFNPETATETEKRNTYSGSPRTFVNVQNYNTTSILAALKAGKSFISNNPMVFADINGKTYGEHISLSGTMTLNYSLKSPEKIFKLIVTKNGETINTIDCNNALTKEGTLTLSGLASGDFIMLEVVGECAGYAITNPIFID